MFNYIKNLKPKSKDLRIFSLILLTLLLVLIFFSYSKQNIFLIKVCFFGLMIAMIGIIKPKLIKPIYFVWMSVGTMMGWILSLIWLSVIYFIIISPISLIMKLFNKNYIKTKLDKNVTTYWNNRLKSDQKSSDYNNQF